MAPSYKELKKQQNKKKQSGLNKHGRPAKRVRCKELVFDPEARRQYLTGFSERKRQRRAYGLAMQKVKDRKAKLEARADIRKAKREQVEEAERLKEKIREDAIAATIGKKKDEKDDDNNEKDNAKEKRQEIKGKRTTTYEDNATQQQWGGDVVVSISTTCFEDSDDDEEDEPPQKVTKSGNRAPKPKTRDTEQEYAGNVEKFLTQFKQKMPATKKKQQLKHGGNHGASAMKGVGNAKEFKLAQKVLARSTKKGGGGKGKRGRK